MRVTLLGRLADGPATVSELVAEMGISQPLTSHHLGQLRGAGLLAAERAGRTVTYRIADTSLAWSIVGVVRQYLASRDVAVRQTDPDPRHGEVAVPHGDHVDLSSAGRFLRLDGARSRWVECEPAGHRSHSRHPHVHGSGCGHVGIPHRDHVDYLHDGHRHAVHGDHYDEH
jgi:DNA-binding transcriptional ArsR family regulator